MIDRCQYRFDLDSAASHYDQCSNFFDASAIELSERLQDIQFSPTRIVELGCRSGRVSELLLSQKNEATIYSFDESQRMAELAKSRLKDKNASIIVSEIDAVPLQSNSVDLTVSNLASSFFDPKRFFSECHRILRHKGVLMFSIFGQNSFRELRDAYSALKQSGFQFDFHDMHDIGDLLLTTGYTNPVVDVETVKYRYSDVSSLIENLRSCGIHSALLSNTQELSSKRVQSSLERAYRHSSQDSGELELSIEYLYGFSWKKELRKGSASVEFHPD